MKHIVIVSFILFISNFCNAQNTNSPYSIFGPGEIQNRGFGVSTAMGGAGIALKSGSHLNSLNPASYLGIDSLHFVSEMGVEGQMSDISSNRNSDTRYTGNIKYLALGFRYNSWLAGSIGVAPFSNVGYNIAKENFIEGSNSTYTSTFIGSGGISQFYFSNAIRLTKHLSVGINSSYMFGSLIQDETINQTDIVPQMTINRQDFLKSLYFDYGIQYSFKIKKIDYSLGVTYSNQQDLTSKHYLSVLDDGNNLVQAEEFDSDYLKVPEKIGVGIGIQNGTKYTVAFDYHFQKWSDVTYPTQFEAFEDLHRFSFGAEFRPWEHRIVNKSFKNWVYRFGINYESSYLKLGGHLIDDKSISLGVGMPLPGRISNMNLSLKYGINGTNTNNLIQENYLKLHLSFSLNEIWFMRRQYD